MCLGCYREYGMPRIVSKETIAAAEAAKAVYEFSPVGGNLHIVLDDWNLDDDCLKFCRDAIDRVRAGKPEKYDDTHGPQIEAEDACLKMLEAMTEDERASAVAMWCEFLGPDGNLTEYANASSE